MNQHISIPEPCHEDWDKMHPNEKGKFCNSCSKTVVDFTKMSKDEIHSYFKQNADKKTCGHFYASQLDKDLKAKPTVFKRVKYFATILLGLFLPLSSCEKQVKGEPVVKSPTKIEKELTGDTVYTGSDQEVPPIPKSERDSVKEKIVNGLPLVKPNKIKK